MKLLSTYRTLQVAINALYVLSEIDGKESLANAGMLIPLLNRVKELDEWGLCLVSGLSLCNTHIRNFCDICNLSGRDCVTVYPPSARSIPWAVAGDGHSCVVCAQGVRGSIRHHERPRIVSCTCQQCSRACHSTCLSTSDVEHGRGPPAGTQRRTSRDTNQQLEVSFVLLRGRNVS